MPSVEGLEHVPENIGASHLMYRFELDDTLFSKRLLHSDNKADGEDAQENAPCVISENQMLNLTSKNWEDHHAPLM